ncbi:Dihydroorotate dehydrogenase [Methylophaga frappieri]|uniref:Dihydroorotate dehydrogenase (quinone) n=1 Tax=Methylophaga frappieri (strain ATCC BAA-2434 / DSM 25690 / JAM7) TaxID=754477 RepID=I1YK28_METFJ|nr:quinone-dependent dihydroorotate dehydrogenase [Methylophaga frappieri]AFJ03271.1 Dihydroorotate dehydrogenase [Methylophaga frappieri]
MKIYPLLRNLMFRLDAETAHHFGLNGLKWLEWSGLLPLLVKQPVFAPVEVMGLTFANPLGLAAGLDKNGDYIEALSQLGFGFIEVGTVTPRPQPGNTRPRLFRLTDAEAIINRMGFNNKGVEYLSEQVQVARTKNTIVGINIGKNFDTPVADAMSDYLFSLNRVYSYADYVAINISSPNTPGLRNLQFGQALDDLLSALKSAQAALAVQHDRYVPMAVKVAPDISQEELTQLAAAFTRYEIDAVIATNTTLDREQVATVPLAEEKGGLSGRPLFAKSTEIVRQFRQVLPEKMPIIAAGGISSGEDAAAKLAAGAALVQIYSGLIYQGPNLIHDIVTTLKQRT